MTEPRAQTAVFTEVAGDLLNRGLGFRFQARGRSMLPVIADGDILHIEPARFCSEYRVGEIVLFRIEGKLKAHRVIRKCYDSLFARGDAGITEEGPIHRADILGRVVAKECLSTRSVVPLNGWRERMRYFSAVLRSRAAVLSRKLLN